MPTDQDALKCVADDVVQRMVAGETAPEEATDRLRNLSMKADRSAWKDLGAFHHLALGWEVAEDSQVGDVDELRREMLREAGELLARGGVRLS
jgi:hypothetical protein